MKKLLALFFILLINLYGVSFSKLQITGDVDFQIEKVYKDGANSGKSQEEDHDIDVDLKLSYPILSSSNFVIKIDDDDEKDSNASSVDLEADQVYITYEQKNFNVQFGLQEITGPFFDEINGDGLLILRSIGNNIFAISYYVDNSFSEEDAVFQTALVGETESIGYSAWYSTIMNSDETTTNYDAKAVQATVFTKGETFKIGLSYTQLDPSNNTSRSLKDKQTQGIVFLNNSDKTVSYEIAYIKTGENGGNVALDEDTDSEANFSLDEVGANDVTDGTAYYLKISKNFAGSNNISIGYFNGDGTTSAEEMRVAYKNYLDKDLYYYIAANRWEKTSQEESEKVEIGFNISF